MHAHCAWPGIFETGQVTLTEMMLGFHHKRNLERIVTSEFTQSHSWAAFSVTAFVSTGTSCQTEWTTKDLLSSSMTAHGHVVWSAYSMYSATAPPMWPTLHSSNDIHRPLCHVCMHMSMCFGSGVCCYVATGSTGTNYCITFRISDIFMFCSWLTKLIRSKGLDPLLPHAWLNPKLSKDLNFGEPLSARTDKNNQKSFSWCTVSV